MKTRRKCLECVTLGELDGTRREYWTRCSHLWFRPIYYSCRILKQHKTFTVLTDGRIQPSSCPFDKR